PDIEVLPLHEALDAFRIVTVFQIVGSELDQQIVFQRHQEAGLSGIALAACAPAKLVVDAATLMAVGADDVQSALVGCPGAKLYVDAAAGHVGGDRYRSQLAGAGDDAGLLFLIARIQDLVGNAAQRGAKPLGLLHAGSPDQNRPAGSVKTF